MSHRAGRGRQRQHIGRAADQGRHVGVAEAQGAQQAQPVLRGWPWRQCREQDGRQGARGHDEPLAQQAASGHASLLWLPARLPTRPHPTCTKCGARMRLGSRRCTSPGGRCSSECRKCMALPTLSSRRSCTQAGRQATRQARGPSTTGNKWWGSRMPHRGCREACSPGAAAVAVSGAAWRRRASWRSVRAGMGMDGRGACRLAGRLCRTCTAAISCWASTPPGRAAPGACSTRGESGGFPRLTAAAARLAAGTTARKGRGGAAAARGQRAQGRPSALHGFSDRRRKAMNDAETRCLPTTTQIVSATGRSLTHVGQRSFAHLSQAGGIAGGNRGQARHRGGSQRHRHLEERKACGFQHRYSRSDARRGMGCKKRTRQPS